MIAGPYGEGDNRVGQVNRKFYYRCKVENRA
jgi:hypothetical protein